MGIAASWMLDLLPVRVLFFNVNGSGLGHMNRCLAYAKAIHVEAESYFFSLASAIEIIDSFGFEADYFVSHNWSAADSRAWNRELACRFGLMLEVVQPDVVVFDGTWPFQGFLTALKAYKGKPRLVWSNRGLLKAEADKVPVPEALFDLVIQPGELGATFSDEHLDSGTKKIVVPPVCLLESDELLSFDAARKLLGIDLGAKAVLFSMGPGNLKDVGAVGSALANDFISWGFDVYWAKPPISVKDPVLPVNVQPLTLYPLAKYLKAFDVFVGAAGYNTCCEVVQAGVPSLLVPNSLVVDDQQKRAELVSTFIPAVVSACESIEDRQSAVDAVIGFSGQSRKPVLLNGAALAGHAILDLMAS